jgi:hypothetical protein
MESFQAVVAMIARQNPEHAGISSVVTASEPSLAWAESTSTS